MPADKTKPATDRTLKTFCMIRCAKKKPLSWCEDRKEAVYFPI
jgi:hypothetical protein